MSADPSLDAVPAHGPSPAAASAATPPAPAPAEVNGASSGPADGPRRSPLLVVWQRRWTVLATILIALAVAMGYLSQATPVYESVARVLVQPSGPRILSGDPSTYTIQTQNFLYTQADVIMSWDLLSGVADELRRAGVDPATMPSFLTERGAVEPTVYLAGAVFADVGRRSDIISVRVRSAHPRDAKLLANAVVDAFYTYHERQQRGSSREILKLLLNQKAKYDGELEAKRSEKLSFLREHRLLAPGEGRVNPALERLVRLSNTLTEAEIATLQAMAAYESTKAMMGDPARVRQLLDSRQFKSETENLRREVRELKRRLAGLSGQYLPNFPELGGIQATLRQLNDEMAEEDRRVVEAYLAELDQRLATARRIEQQLRERFDAQRGEVLELNDVAARYQIIESQIAALERAGEAIDSRIKELSLTESASPLNITTVERARENHQPVSPKRATVLFYALAGGLMGGAALALAREALDQRLRSADEIRQTLHLPILGVLPHIDARSARQRGMQVHLDPMSDVAESYRTIRTAIYFGASAQSRRSRTVLVTSPAPGDGKTTLASNLAIAMAQAGNRILLLDADFRRPVQHRIFQLENSKGMCGVLAGAATLDEAICRTAVAGLEILPCGPMPANPSEILSGQAFADLLAQLCSRYDHVVLDSPPVVPVTDARILSASCDATVLALRADRSTRRAAVYARDVLRSVGANIIGTVVNDVPRHGGGYAYEYGERYAYPYGHGRRAREEQNGASNGNGNAGPPAVATSVPDADHERCS